MNIFHVASECVPFAKTGGLADVVGSLPAALSKLGHKVCVALPAYRGTLSKIEKSSKKYSIRGKNEDLAVEGTVYEHESDTGITFYLFENKEYFYRDYLYGTPESDYPDNLDRFMFFCKAFLEFLPTLSFKPDVLHCHDWQTSLIPLYLKSIYAGNNFYNSIRSVYTIHNLGYQGLFPATEFPKLGIPDSYYSIDGIEFYHKINLMKGGIFYSDKITTVSKKYSKEIQTIEYGCGLEGVLNVRKNDIIGIVNGIDYSLWNPAKDKFLAAKFSEKNISGKQECKQALLERFGLPVNLQTPIIAMISRLADQKGFDILMDVFDKLMELDIFFVLLGTGDKKYHDLFEKLSKQYKNRTGIMIAFDNALAHQIEAGADMFLMPSQYEPCGLNQLISLKYGTIPIVRGTGGLDDTILDYSENQSRGNGFKFFEYSGKSLLDKVVSAIDVYNDRESWITLQKRAMKQDFSWKTAAKQYIELYSQLTCGLIE
ncbi:MAG: starch synthase [Candidatus Schekmanbacteria bacterium RBG_13_48_7]|uniref:Glycogen synthase n=1 Tax=Candidatus Schekmanbacteria bacterium RBG_13_48_7 TaxID=1817878 RepID=A0A1F7S4P7_9BACT|nr:MAG: starch synthase [Candidatus Schekmanbacteria bacterium RBG_13_48_7]